MWPFSRKVLSISELIANLRDNNSDRRLRAAETLGNSGEVVAIPALIDTLHDADHDVRKAAAYALGKFGEQSKDALPILVKMIRDDTICLGDVLGQIGRPAVPHIIDLISPKVHFPLLEGLHALKIMGPVGKDALPTLQRLQQDLTHDVLYSFVIRNAIQKVALATAHDGGT